MTCQHACFEPPRATSSFLGLRRLFRLGMGALLLGSGTIWAQPAETLQFGLISVSSPQALRQTWGPVIEDLRQQTGLKVSLYFATNYDMIVDAMRKKKIHLGFISPKPAIEAVDSAGGEVILQTVTSGGMRGYHSLLIVHQNSRLKSPNDLFQNMSALTLGHGDLKSTSGYLVPELMFFAKHNINSKTAFASVRHANHEANALAVANRQVDVATSNNLAMGRFENRFPDRYPEIRVLWESPLLPNAPIVVRKDLSPHITAKVKNFLVNYGRHSERERKLLERMELEGFVDASNAILNPIRVLELHAQRLKLRDDPSLTPDEKSKLISQIDSKIKALE